MSTSILEIINAGGYDLTTLEDARWLIANVNEFEELIEQAENLIEEDEDRENIEAERVYQAHLPASEH